MTSEHSWLGFLNTNTDPPLFNVRKLKVDPPPPVLMGKEKNIVKAKSWSDHQAVTPSLLVLSSNLLSTDIRSKRLY